MRQVRRWRMSPVSRRNTASSSAPATRRRPAGQFRIRRGESSPRCPASAGCTASTASRFTACGHAQHVPGIGEHVSSDNRIDVRVGDISFSDPRE